MMLLLCLLLLLTRLLTRFGAAAVGIVPAVGGVGVAVVVEPDVCTV